MKKVLLMFIALMSVVCLSAQELRMPKYKFTDNWSISVGGGIMSSFGDKQSSFEHKDFSNPSVHLGLNKYFTPVAGARFQGEWKKFNTELKDVHTAGVYSDLLINPINIFNSNYDRKFNVVIPIGVGYLHSFKNDQSAKQDFLIPRVGLQLNYDITDAVQLNLEGTASLSHDKLDFIVNKAQYDGFITTSLGITYKFKNHNGSRGFKYIPSYDQEDIDFLNEEINRIKAECEKTPKTITVVDTIHVKDTVFVREVSPTTIRFHINSAEIASEQMANVRNIADHVKDNAIKKLVVTGYADVKTGTPEYNQKLSEKRAESVKRALISFGVPEDRLIVGAEGDKVQQYEDNDWNRATIIVSQN